MDFERGCRLMLLLRPLRSIGESELSIAYRPKSSRTIRRHCGGFMLRATR